MGGERRPHQPACLSNPIHETKKEGGGKTGARVFDNADGEPLERSVFMGYRMTYSRLIGALFIAGFVVYGAGFGLQMSLGLGALFLCLLLFRTRLVPQ